MVNISRAVGINAALSAFVRPEGLGHMMRAGDEGLRVYSVFQGFFCFFFFCETPVGIIARLMPFGSVASWKLLD